jgi:hypothetical protein
MRLRIESVDGSPINDYRIREGQVEVRVLDAAGHAWHSPLGLWRVLGEDDIQLHHALGTVVSKWLQQRLGGASVVASAVSKGFAA